MISELEKILFEMIAEHRALLAEAQLHAAAVRKLDLAVMEHSAARQDAARARIAMLENRRKLQTQIDARTLRLPPNATLAQLAHADPARRPRLLALRDELRKVAFAIAQQTHVTARVTGAVLGHLNTTVRLLSSTVQHAGTYTKQGTPRVATRIGVMEAVA